LDQSFFIRVKIGIKPTAEHKGGLNLFGCGFVYVPQDLVLHIIYQSK
jgi:predicted transcriptional regulator